MSGMHAMSQARACKHAVRGMPDCWRRVAVAAWRHTTLQAHESTVQESWWRAERDRARKKISDVVTHCRCGALCATESKPEGTVALCSPFMLHLHATHAPLHQPTLNTHSDCAMHEAQPSKRQTNSGRPLGRQFES